MALHYARSHGCMNTVVILPLQILLLGVKKFRGFQELMHNAKAVVESYFGRRMCEMFRLWSYVDLTICKLFSSTSFVAVAKAFLVLLMSYRTPCLSELHDYVITDVACRLESVLMSPQT